MLLGHTAWSETVDEDAIAVLGRCGLAHGLENDVVSGWKDRAHAPRGGVLRARPGDQGPYSATPR